MRGDNPESISKSRVNYTQVSGMQCGRSYKGSPKRVEALKRMHLKVCDVCRKASKN